MTAPPHQLIPATPTSMKTQITSNGRKANYAHSKTIFEDLATEQGKHLHLSTTQTNQRRNRCRQPTSRDPLTLIDDWITFSKPDPKERAYHNKPQTEHKTNILTKHNTKTNIFEQT